MMGASLSFRRRLNRCSRCWHENLPRIAWHVGNRHTPCQIADDHILIRQDVVLQAMLEQLGATVRQLTTPFMPEGGAYGHGRTHGHEH